MKTGWQKYATRKDKLETIAVRGQELGTIAEAACAWSKLMDCMLELSAPEAPRTPKFNDLLLSIIRSYSQAERIGRELRAKGYAVELLQ